MFCSKCGAENPDNAKFCGSCGAVIAVAETSPKGAPAKPHPGADEAKPSVSLALKIGISLASLIVPLIGIIMGILYLRDAEDSEKRSAGKLWLTIGIIMMLINIMVMIGGGY